MFLSDQTNPVVHETPLAEMLRLPAVPEDVVTQYWAAGAEGYLRNLAALAVHPGLDVTTIGADPQGYEILLISRNSSIIAARHVATGAFIGGIDYRDFFVREEHRGMGVGSHLLLHAFDQRIRNPVMRGHFLSEGGKRTVVAAHRLAVKRAIDGGLDVPSAVACDYPDLIGVAVTP